MSDDFFKKAVPLISAIALIFLAFLIIKPILMAIILGILLAFIFSPIYKFAIKFLKRKNLTASLICLLLIVLIIVPLWYLAPAVINQSIKFYIASQQMDFVTTLTKFFPNFFQSDTFSNEVANALRTFITKATNSLMNSFSSILLNIPKIILQLIVVFFTFFFVLRDGDKLVLYVKSLLPFSRDVDEKLIKSTKEITLSVLYGQVIVGIIQGLIAAIGFFVFKAPNAVLLAVLAAFAGIIPVFGNVIVWLPVAVYFLIAGNTLAALGVTAFGLISILIETLLKPIFVSKFTKLNSSIILIGIIGGLFVFGIFGVILGPLILAYLLIILEIYRDKKTPEVFIQKPEKE
ncbi:MAG: AI-2E family transporter [Candidatus Diapherotrites archaeon]